MTRCRTTNARVNKLRQGGVYIAVLGVAMIVSIVSFSAMQVSRLQRKLALASGEVAEAQRMAQSAVEYALAQITADSSWRTTYVSGNEYPASWVSLGGSGDFKFVLTDSDGSLSDNVNDGVILKGIGRSGDAIHIVTVTLEPTGNPLDCLAISFCTNGTLDTTLTVTLVSDQTISSNGNIDVTSMGSSIVGNAEAVGTISGAVAGITTEGISPRELPHDYVFDYYLHNGTWIDVNSLPLESTNKPLISGVLLAPKANPYGATNPAGIYVIDCQGMDLCIRDCRIVGTIVLLNPGSSTGLESSVAIEPAVPNFPSLLVQGDLLVKTSDTDLSEMALGVNLNPVGTPYQDIENSDQNDVYPSVVEGLVYVSGKLKLFPDMLDSKFRGVVVCNEVLACSDASFEYDGIFFRNPPPGFAQGPEWRVMPASWQRVSY